MEIVCGACSVDNPDGAKFCIGCGTGLAPACQSCGKEKPPAIRLHVGGADGVLTLEVQDDGPGVPAGEERVIFEPFERGAGGPGVESGVGLGLALARDLARSLGGDLKLVSAAGAGACFCLTLPGLLRTGHRAAVGMPRHDATPAG